MTGRHAIEGDVVGGVRLTAATADLENGVVDVGSFRPGASFLVGTVVVCEPRELDYRFWGRAKPSLVNRYGAATLKASLALLGKATVAPKLLTLPAGTFWYPLPHTKAEERAATFITSLVSSLGKELKKAKGNGLMSIVLGVDSTSNGCQVPVHIDLTGARANVTGLARRSDGSSPDKFAHESFKGSRSIVVGRSTIYVAYCGEINKTFKFGEVQSLTLGTSQTYDAVVDLAHYFRWPRAPRGTEKQNKSGLAYFLRGCANAAGPARLAAPVFVSVALVGRTPYTKAADGAARSYWLAVNSRNRKDLTAGVDYRRPDAVLALYPPRKDEAGDASPLLTVNLFT
jgi:hypothetical protein